MNRLYVFLEKSGSFEKVGELLQDGAGQVSFSYSKAYIDAADAAPLSIHLPFQEGPFDPTSTAIFFDGLLPEGFLRRQLASSIRTPENDYFSILRLIGAECLGAVWVVDPDSELPKPGYTEVDDVTIRSLAKEGASKSVTLLLKTHLSLTGASGKVGLYYDEKAGKWYLPSGTAPSTHIVKQSHIRLNDIVINEKLCQLTAKKLGIDVPESFIIKASGYDDGDVLFATKRYDRLMYAPNGSNREEKRADGLIIPYRLHQEDLSQALGISSAEKYEKPGGEYLKRAFELVRNYVTDPLTDSYKLWDYLIFDYLIGNTDNHIKNLSFIYTPDLKGVKLAPLYDTVSTVIYESSTHDMSMAIDGKYSIDEINRQSFGNVTGELLLGKKKAMEHFDRLRDGFEAALNESVKDLLDEGFTAASKIGDEILKARKF